MPQKFTMKCKEIYDQLSEDVIRLLFKSMA